MKFNTIAHITLRIFLASALTATSSPHPGITYQVEAQYPIFQKGMSYVTWSEEGFASNASDESLKLMREASVSSVAIVVTWYQEEFNSPAMAPTDRSPSDSSVRHAIQSAHKNNMSVMLKPHIDLIRQDGTNRSDIGFQTADKWEEWFANYEAFITRYARMASEENVEFFSVGTELAFAAAQTDYWKERIIPAVREVFAGQITYAANWDDYQKVGFWDDLDYAGIDAYFPLSDKEDPSIDDIKEGWRAWIYDMERWQGDIKKPVLFTECGYCSVDSAPQKPWEESGPTKPNMRIQADCYRALLETFWDRPWFFGVYWWNWNTFPGSGGENNRHFTPQNKPALACVKEWYESRPVGEKDTFTPLERKFLTGFTLSAKAQYMGDAETKERIILETIVAETRSAEEGKAITFTSQRAVKQKAASGKDLIPN